MAFRASTQIPDLALARAKSLAGALRTFAVSFSATLAAGANADRVLQGINTLVSHRTQLNLVKDVPGLAAYAQAQENDGTYDIVAEFTALLAIVDTAIDNTIAAIPTGPGGYALLHTVAANGSITPRTFTPAQLAGVKADVDAIVAAIT